MQIRAIVVMTYPRHLGGVHKRDACASVGDKLIETENGIAKNDLRVFIKGINVIEFIEWFNSKEDRETSPWREFSEELVAPNILPRKEFR